jgi:hypothetical protein
MENFSWSNIKNDPVYLNKKINYATIKSEFLAKLKSENGGADSGFSLNKDEFAEMIKAVRDTESALGKVDYTIDKINRQSARSLFVVKDIKKGEKCF